MKKLYVLPLLLACVLPAEARQLSPQEALSRVEKIPTTAAHKFAVKGSPAPVLTVTAPKDSNFTGLYVFKTGTTGYMIVSADDCAVPLLGYADAGSFDVANMPEAMRNWLNFYADQIAWASQKGLPTVNSNMQTASEGQPAISPMLTCKWNQGAPYNDDCPLDNDKRSVTGCVATAMAQAMYYHQWPNTGTGSHTYKWHDQDLTIDYASTTYDWSAMTPTYDKESTDAAKAAVANLMYSCGVSVDMNYSSGESGASSWSIGPALYKYFGYDKSMVMPIRSFYGDEEWNNMVYDQLANGMPVLYGGQSYEGGHQFVCDGYDGNGYFHFNWGWGGMSDGYFLLSALNPIDQGIGGSESDSGFNYDQGIVINMKPAQADSQITPLIYCYGNFGIKETGEVELGKEITLKSSDGFYNFGVTDVDVAMGIKLTASDGTVQYVKHGAELGFGSVSGYASYTVTLPKDLTDGTYVVTPALLPKDATEWIDVRCPLSGVQALEMTVSDGKATFADDITNKLEVSNFTINTPIYLNENFSISFTLTNTGTTEYFGEYLLFLLDTDGTKLAPSADINCVDILPGESVDVTYISKFTKTVKTDDGEQDIAPGEYGLGLYTHFSKQHLYTYTGTVNVADAPAATTIKVTDFSVDNGKSVVNTEDVKFTGTVECTEGYFTGQLKVSVFRSDTRERVKSAKTEDLFVNDGQSQDFTADINLVSEDPTEEYYAVVYDGNEAISEELHFVISSTGVVGVKDNSGIEILLAGEELTVKSELPINSAVLYTIDGIAVSVTHGNGDTGLTLPLSQLTPGNYILVVKDQTGREGTKHFVF